MMAVILTGCGNGQTSVQTDSETVATVESSTEENSNAATDLLNSCNSHLMTNYKAALDNEEKNCGFIQLSCDENTLNENKSIESENDDVESIAVITDFSIEGKWKSVGAYGFGQAQPGVIVAFDGKNIMGCGWLIMCTLKTAVSKS